MGNISGSGKDDTSKMVRTSGISLTMDVSFTLFLFATCVKTGLHVLIFM